MGTLTETFGILHSLPHRLAGDKKNLCYIDDNDKVLKLRGYFKLYAERKGYKTSKKQQPC